MSINAKKLTHLNIYGNVISHGVDLTCGGQELFVQHQVWIALTVCDKPVLLQHHMWTV